VYRTTKTNRGRKKDNLTVLEDPTWEKYYLAWRVRYNRTERRGRQLCDGKIKRTQVRGVKGFKKSLLVSQRGGGKRGGRTRPTPWLGEWRGCTT